MPSPNRVSEGDRARAAIMGLVYGDAIGGTHQQNLNEFGEEEVCPPLSTSIWTKLTCAQASSVVERSGFDSRSVSSALSDTLSDSSGGNLDDQTVTALKRLESGTNWDDAGKVGSIDGTRQFGPLVRNCVLAPAYRSFRDELDYVTHLSTSITHNNSDIMRASATINNILAELINNGEPEDLSSFFKPTPGGVPKKDFEGLIRSIERFREDGSLSVSDLRYPGRTDGSAYLFVRGLLMIGLGAEDTKIALEIARNGSWQSEVMTPVVGSLIGARFGTDAFPNLWSYEIKNVCEFHQLANDLSQINHAREGPPSHETDSTFVHGHKIIGPTYLERSHRYDNVEMLRPEPAPHDYLDTLGRGLTKSQSVFFDWEHMAQRGYLYSENHDLYTEWIRVPEYTLAEKVEELPDQDLKRLRGLARRACDNAKEAIDIYQNTWDLTLNHELLGEEGQDRISSHLGYMIRSIAWPLNDLKNELNFEELIKSKQHLDSTTRLLVRLEDDMSITSDFMCWNEDFWEPYSGLLPRVFFTTGAVRQAIESLRMLVIRHPEYSHDDWERHSLNTIERT